MTDRIPDDVLDAVEREAHRTLRVHCEHAYANTILRLVAHYRASAPAARHAATDAVIAAAIVPDDRAPVPASVPDFEAWAVDTYSTPSGYGGVWVKEMLQRRIAAALRAAWEHREP